MIRISTILFLLLGIILSADAQQGQSIGPNAPCAAFGSVSGTCAQGNDARLGAGAVTGALKSNGANVFSQAASTDLSDTALLARLASPALTGTPTAPTQSAGDNTTALATDAFVTTAVNNAIAGVNPAIAVSAATTAAADTSGCTYANGVAGVGATLTCEVNTVKVIDGFTFNTITTQSLLVKNDTQSPSGAFNGIYVLTALHTAGTGDIYTRRLDYDQPSDINNTGAIPVVNGTANGTTSWLLTSNVTTVGTSPLTYTKFSINPATLAAVATSGSASDLTTGTLAAARMPALTGDCTTSAGAVATTCTKINGVDQTVSWISYSPTVTATAGTFTSVSCACNYHILGKTIFIQGAVTVTTIGSASGRMLVPAPGGTTFAVASPISALINATVVAQPALCDFDSNTAISINMGAITSGQIMYFNGVCQTT